MFRFVQVCPIALALAFAACGPGVPGGPTMSNKMNAPEPVPQSSGVVSTDILGREPLSNTAQVKHILIGWKDSDSKDARAVKRSKAEAETEVRSLMKQLAAGADFDVLMKANSEDPGSAESGRSYTVSPDAQLVIEFKQLGLRLKIDEVGVVQSDFGFHIMKRVQ